MIELVKGNSANRKIVTAIVRIRLLVHSVNNNIMAWLRKRKRDAFRRPTVRTRNFASWPHAHPQKHEARAHLPPNTHDHRRLLKISSCLKLCVCVTHTHTHTRVTRNKTSYEWIPRNPHDRFRRNEEPDGIRQFSLGRGDDTCQKSLYPKTPGNSWDTPWTALKISNPITDNLYRDPCTGTEIFIMVANI